MARNRPLTSRQLTRLMYEHYKSTHPCAHKDAKGTPCGSRKDVQFHHKDPHKKVDTVGNMVKKGVSWEQVVQELQKCTPLCEKHHKEIHEEWRRLGFWK